MKAMCRWTGTSSSGSSNFTRSAQASNFAASKKEEKEMFQSLVRFFQMGGFFMFPIVIVLAVGLAIAAERWIQLRRAQDANKKTWDSIHPVLVKGEFEKARELVNKDRSEMAQMLGMGLARQGAVRRREDVEIAMEESMMEIIPQLEKRTQYLALLSNIATLFGLLGTIMGLIEAFTAVAGANPAQKASLLAASISTAMNCTAFGLMAAIPLLLFHARLTTTTGHIVNSLEMASVKALNSISSFTKRQFEKTPFIPSINATGAEHVQTI